MVELEGRGESPALHDLQAEVQQPCQGLGNHPLRAVILHSVGGHHSVPSWVWILIFVYWTGTAHSFPCRMALEGDNRVTDMQG